MWSQRTKCQGEWSVGLNARAVERATNVIGCDLNKSVKSSLHCENLKIMDSSISLKIINIGEKTTSKKFQ